MSTLGVEPGKGLSNRWFLPFPFAFSPKFLRGFLRSCAQLVQVMIMKIPGISGVFPATVIQSSHIQRVGETQSGISSHRGHSFTSFAFIYILYFILQICKYIHVCARACVLSMAVPPK